MRGGCFCGSVRFQGHGAPAGVVVCHCRMCARWSGSPAITVEFEQGITFEGEVNWIRSSEWGERGFCPSCGSTLFFRLIEGGYINAGAGFFDDPDSVPAITLEIHVDAQPRYYTFTGEAPRLTGEELLARLDGGKA